VQEEENEIANSEKQQAQSKPQTTYEGESQYKVVGPENSESAQLEEASELTAVVVAAAVIEETKEEAPKEELVSVPEEVLPPRHVLDIDYDELLANPVEGVKVISALSLARKEWLLRINGPENSPYADGIFRVSLFFNADYPLSAPTCKFRTKIYHPQVADDGTGKFWLYKKADEHKVSDFVKMIVS
jgi:hypothetical protein